MHARYCSPWGSSVSPHAFLGPRWTSDLTRGVTVVWYLTKQDPALRKLMDSLDCGLALLLVAGLWIGFAFSHWCGVTVSSVSARVPWTWRLYTLLGQEF